MKQKVHNLCEICSDKGIGRHFGAITCESCKIFFRRNALKDQVMDCTSDGKCKINPFTRKLCTKCRLNKCFAVGMRKELIRNDREREERRQLVEENRRKRKLLNKSQNTSSESNESSNPASIESTISTISSDSIDSFLSEIIGCVLDVSDEDLGAQIMEIENYVNYKDSDQNIEALSARQLLDDIHQKSQQMSVIPMFKELTDYNGFKQLEINRIAELLGSSQIFDYPSSKNLIKMMDITEYARISMKKCEVSIKEVLNYIKGLTGFTSLCREDQYTLFKYGCPELVFIRSLWYYNHDSKYFSLYLDNDTSIIVGFDLFKDVITKYYLPFKELYEKYLDQFIPLWNRDRVILELLTAIALFNPNRPNLKHRHSIRLEQQLYIYLLQRYLLLKCRSDYDSQERLCQLMNTFADIYKITELQKAANIDEIKRYRQKYGPLMSEIYDLPGSE